MNPQEIQLIYTMMHGNPGALTVMHLLLGGVEASQAQKDRGIAYIQKLKEHGIEGGNIWIGFKDFCGENIDEMKARIDDGSLFALIKQSPDFIQYD